MITKINILLVDDDPVSHFISTKVLQQMGLNEIYTATNGKEALKLMDAISSERQPVRNAIFLDLDMPILDGFGFIEAFKKLNIPHKDKIHIIILTSSSNPIDKKRAIELGISHYLIKPMSEKTARPILESFVSV